MAEEAMTSETWREVDGYGGIYEVSTLGRVRSVDRVLADGRNMRGVILAQNKVGPTRRYLAVHLYDSEGRRTAARARVHA